MKAKVGLSIFFLFIHAVSLYAAEQIPVAVSPASEMGLARIGSVCPTFSWTVVDWAAAYRLEVFPVGDNSDLTYEKITSQAHPLLVKEIQGSATSWTPSMEQPLDNHTTYIWFVQALGPLGNGEWSEGRLFRVEAPPGFAAIEDVLRQTLDEHGVSNDIIGDVLNKMKQVPGGDINSTRDSQEFTENLINRFSILGNEVGSNTTYGEGAGSALTTGIRNTIIGYYAGDDTTTANDNSFLGAFSGWQNSTGYENTFIGSSAGYYNTTGSENTYVGYRAGVGNYTGFYNSCFGYEAGYSNTGNYNTFVGHNAAWHNTSGYANTIIGREAGYNSTTGNLNTFLGHYSGRSNTTGYSNTYLGERAGYTSTTGYENTFVGREAGFANTTGSLNTFLGRQSGNANTTGGSNTLVGYGAGMSNTTGYSNTQIGYVAGRFCTTGIQNSSLGWGAGANNIVGSGNVFLGYKAGFSETRSNRLYIDNSDTSNPLIYGNFATDTLAFMGTVGVGTKTPAFPMEMKKTGTNASIVVDRTDGATNYINATATSGNFGTVTNHVLRLVVNSMWRLRLHTDNSLTMKNGASCTAGGVWTDASSRELKENINNLTKEKALEALCDLQPVTYNYKADTEDAHVGFIAEDVPDLVASKDRRGMSPMDVVAVLTKVLQEQQKTIDELKAEVEQLKKESKSDK